MKLILKLVFFSMNFTLVLTHLPTNPLGILSLYQGVVKGPWFQLPLQLIHGTSSHPPRFCGYTAGHSTTSDPKPELNLSARSDFLGSTNLHVKQWEMAQNRGFPGSFFLNRVVKGGGSKGRGFPNLP